MNFLHKLFRLLGKTNFGWEEWKAPEPVEKSEGGFSEHKGWPGKKGFSLSRVFLSFFFSLIARDYNGQDPPRECEAGERQVQDPEGSEEREYQEEGGPVWKHVDILVFWYLP